MKKERTPLYTFARGIAWLICSVIFGSSASGLENFPQDENCIIIGNHISGWDPIMVARYYGVSEVHFIAKESLFRNPVLRWLLTKLHAFAVHRGETDMAAMRKAMQVVQDGHVLGIFPQGTRQAEGAVKTIETGVAVIALKSDVPLIPVRVSGRYRPFGGLHLAVGPRIAVDDLRAGRADAQALEEVKRRIIAALEALDGEKRT